MQYMKWTLTRGEDEIDVDLEYEISAFTPAVVSGPPEHCSPAEGGEIEELNCYDANTGEGIALTETEVAQAEEFIINNHEFDDGFDFDDGNITE